MTYDLDAALTGSLVMLALSLATATRLWSVVSWAVQVKRSIAVCFLVSVGWNWYHLYLVALAEQQLKMFEAERCEVEADGLSWWQRLGRAPCSPVAAVTAVSPMLSVPPTKALVVTVTGLLVDPLAQLGGGLGTGLRALLRDLPITLHIPAMIIAGIVAVGVSKAIVSQLVAHLLPNPTLGLAEESSRKVHRQLPTYSDFNPTLSENASNHHPCAAVDHSDGVVPDNIGDNPGDQHSSPLFYPGP